jgi:hypothetical protein
MDQIYQQLATALGQALGLAFLLFGLYLFGYAKNLLQQKLGEMGYARLVAYTNDVVKMLEQHPAYKDMLGAEKLQVAMVKVSKFASENLGKAGIAIDEILIRTLVESAVYSAKGAYSELEGLAPLEMGTAGG